ncbi:hypothetical protein LguiB_032293 [Lonicera macranthoides]
MASQLPLALALPLHHPHPHHYPFSSLTLVGPSIHLRNSFSIKQKHNGKNYKTSRARYNSLKLGFTSENPLVNNPSDHNNIYATTNEDGVTSPSSEVVVTDPTTSIERSITNENVLMSPDKNETVKEEATGIRDGDEVKFEATFEVPLDFGEIGAVIVRNEHDKEMYLYNISLVQPSNGTLIINCNSWVHSKDDNPEDRIFFTNKSYLPSQTPSGVRRLREKELRILRGDGGGERKKFERIYDYDVYNDLGNPDVDTKLLRPVLGGTEYAYPRRCRTGRPRCKTDPSSESRSDDIYLPRHEEFSEEWPLTSKLGPEVYGPTKSTITKEIVEEQIKGFMAFEEALDHGKLFILDYHDLFLQYVNKVRDIEGTTLYGSRTLMFLKPTEELILVAIELTCPPANNEPQWKQVFTPSSNATDAWLWKLAKAHVLAHDSGYHQLILRVIYVRLKGNRNCLMQLTKARLGMAKEDSTAPHGLKLAIEDYPFASDGLILWDAIKEWVTSYVNYYYPDASLVESDSELQAWWTEIRTVGHGDKKDDPLWPDLNTPKDLIEILTIMMWVTSGHHAAVNYGQYDFAGYFPNRPSIARTKMPNEVSKEEEIDEKEEWKQFVKNPEQALLACFPSVHQATLVIAVLDRLSTHSKDEEYIGQCIEPSWEENQILMSAFQTFTSRLRDLKDTIDRRNVDKNLKNRTGVGLIPYELFIPTSKEGVTGQGVPNSISI